MRKPIFVLLALCWSSLAAFAEPPSPVTPPTPPGTSEILTAAEGAAADLKAFRLKVAANVNVTIDPTSAAQLTAAADGLTSGLRKLIQDFHAANERGADTQDITRELTAMIGRLRMVLARQQGPLFLTAPALLSGLQSIQADLQHPLLTTAGEGALRFDYFQFNGEAPGIMAGRGGTMTLVGKGLWEDFEPEVDLRRDGNVIQKLIVEKGASPGQVTSHVDADLIKNNPGQCLQIHVTAYRPRLWFLTEKLQLMRTACIAPSFKADLEITAGLQYQCPEVQRRTLEAERKLFGWDNHNCTAPRTVAATQTWAMEGDKEGCRIVDFKLIKEEEQVGGSHVNVVIASPTSLAANGTLAAAECSTSKPLIPFLGTKKDKLERPAVWAKYAVPVLECPVTVAKTAEAQSRVVSLALARVQTEIDLPKPVCEAKEPAAWFAVTPVINGVKGKELLRKEGAQFEPVQADNLLFESKLNALPQEPRLELTISVAPTK